MYSFKKYFILAIAPVIFITFFSCRQNMENDENRFPVQGWNILSQHEEQAERVIERSRDYNINHLQLSHQIIMDLRHAKNPGVATKVNRLTKEAHEAGIEEVCVWDHALYHLDYYPDKFRTGPNDLINLDNPEFWKWIKNDYREMLDLVPDIDGIILTFIETGAHVEDQYSEVMKTEEEKLAAMVDTLASVIIDERGLQLYVRTFVYNRAELSSMLKCINLVKNPKLRVMTKEVPHDFFLTHPVSQFVEDIRFPTIIEFDAAHEYNGQGIIASMFPDIHLKRWAFYRNLPNVIGYVARTDRGNTTTIIDNPAEINLFAIKKAVDDEITPPADSIYAQFIRETYGDESLIYLEPAFKKAAEAVKSSFYTLGLNINSHSRLQYNDNSSYQRHVSGKWMENPVIHIGHSIDKEFHYWKDVVNHLAPAEYKRSENTQLARESQWVFQKGWLQPEELITREYLDYVLTEKKYGTQQAKEALELVKQTEPIVENKVHYDTLLHVFERTAMTAELYEATAKLFFGYRLLAKKNGADKDYATEIVDDGLKHTFDICMTMNEYPHKGPTGQFHWQEDVYRGLAYYNTVKLRENDDYRVRFFPYFPFGGLEEEARTEIWQTAMDNKP